MRIIGQNHNLEIINKWQILPNFLIIQGDKHSGKTNLTLYLCEKFGLYYKKMNKSVKDVRSLIDVMKPNSNTVYHFKDFNDATSQAKNALLKITEEPVPGNYIVITGGPQIKTLESRARRIVMEPYTLSEMKEYMRPIFLEDSLQEKLYAAGFNTPGKIEYYKRYEQIQGLLDFSYDIFDKITYIEPDNILLLISRFESWYDKDKIDAVHLFLSILINIIEYNIKVKHYYSYREILQILLKTKQSLEREDTLNRKMLLFKAFYEIQLLRRR